MCCLLVKWEICSLNAWALNQMGGGVDFNQTDHLSQFIYIHRIVLYVLYLVSTIFGGKRFCNNEVWIWISIFGNVPFLIHIWMTFCNVLDLAEAAFRQKYTAKCNVYSKQSLSYSVSTDVFYRLMWSSLYRNPPQNSLPN